MFEEVLKKFSEGVSFDKGKLMNKGTLDISKVDRGRKKIIKNLIEGYIEGTVKNVKRGFADYYTVVTLKVKHGDTYKTENFRIYDITRKLFSDTIKINDTVTCFCQYNVEDSKGRYYNKIKTFNKMETKPMMKTMIFEGTLTNTFNTRDKRKDNEVSFCFKPSSSKKVCYVVADKQFTQSQWFNKNEKINVEVMEEDRNLKYPNKTYRLITMWKS